MKTRFSGAFAAVGICVFLFSGHVMADSFVVLAKQGLSANFAAEVEAAGGRVTAVIPEIGVAVVEADADFRTRGSRISGVQSIAANIKARMIAPFEGDMLPVEEVFANPPASADNDFFFDLQWGHQAIDAAGAWNAGYRGAGVRVAVLDSGIDAEHPDIAPNLNAALSASFVPGEDWNVQPGFFFNHGTHVAGTIAAADNGFGVIGVAPEAEIVAVKVLSEVSGSGSFAGIAQGMVYAGLIEADVANMSLGATIPHNCTFDVLDGGGNPTGETEHFPAADCAALLNMLKRAATFARSQGVTIISSAGNEAIDLDHFGSNIKIPAELPGVVSITATGPVGWALDPFNADFSHLASYSNYGQSSTFLSAPGGDFILPGNDICLQGGVIQYCWVMDMVFSTISGGWSWSAGTSMASPHAAGVAALIIGKNGGQMDPAQVLSEMQRSAVDLGKPGRDDAHGFGAVNAANAVAD